MADKYLAAHRAWRAQQKKFVLTEVVNDPNSPYHGQKGTYDAGCRCERCRKAKSDSERATRKKHATSNSMERWGQPWTGDELDMLRGGYGTVPAPELARQLGRSVDSVRSHAWRMGLTSRKDAAKHVE